METSLKRITAVLGPTNTGKTHLAVEIMLKYRSGIIGFPLRLLAREIFDKCVKKIGTEKVALITGEEKIIPNSPFTFVKSQIDFQKIFGLSTDHFQILSKLSPELIL